MKYIRTKDNEIGVIFQDPFFKDTYSVSNKKGTMIMSCLDLKEIGKVADTIEELCDKFVFDGIVWDKLEDVMFCLDKEDYTKIYGAIWTDKGLIYVAKMNEKGELELL